MSLFRYISFLKKVNIFDFFYLNYFCKSIIRTDHYKVIPYKNAVIEIPKTAKIYVESGDIEIGCDVLRKSHEETRIRLGENAIWTSKGGCKISYGSTIEVLNNAVLNSDYFTMNCNSVLVSAKRIDIGQDVMLGRNVVIYDSDFHTLIGKNGEVLNPSASVKIENHVWLGTNVMVLKGTIIGKNSVVGANTIVKKKITEGVIYKTKQEGLIRDEVGKWNREFV